ncbi:MAG: ATP-binding protein, partial [Nitrospinae bacterium]|nr:ATP-binding protein [Nitrospinota bacterium]
MNPFEDDIVVDPRKVRDSVKGLNDRILERLLAQFHRLEEGLLPHSHKISHAQLVVSAEPGNGKSHLIGRLFQRLSKRATLIYIRPFQNPTLCWRNILHRIIQELELPEGFEVETSGPTQLDLFCRSVINTIGEGIGLSEERVKREWGMHLLDAQKVLRKHGVYIDHLMSWLNVLFSYAYNEDSEIRDICISWMKGEEMDTGDVEKVGLRRNHVWHPESSPEEINERCKGIVFDLCRFSGFFRPFVFCFDQTELYSDDPKLAATFGAVISEMVENGLNQMTVITTNRTPWEKFITPFMQLAFQHRFAYPPLQFEYINKDQAKELIRLRLRGCSLSEKEIDAFIDDKWLDSLFPTPTSEHSIRRFLQRCKERWDQDLFPQVLPSRRSLEELYEGYYNKLIGKPERLRLDSDILQWLVRDAPASGLKTEDHKCERGIFSVLWREGNHHTYLGFEGSNHWKRWHSILRLICGLSDANREKGITSRFVIIRTSELKPVPGDWKIAGEMRDALKDNLSIVRLNHEEMAM